MTFEYRIATAEDLEQLWTYNITRNPDEPAWVRWKEQYIGYNRGGQGITFAVVCGGEAVGEGTLLLWPGCSAIQGRLDLADGKTVGNVNALRIRKAYEGQGHISRMVKMLEEHARSLGLERLTIGVEANEARNLAIYLHWGYNRLVRWEEEDGALILYYEKNLTE